MNQKMKTEKKLRLKGLAKIIPGHQESFREATGTELIREGDDYVIFLNDTHLNEIPNFLQAGDEHDIRQSNTAEELVSELRNAEQNNKVSTPENVTSPSNLGFLSQLHAAATSFFFQPLEHLQKTLLNRVFPVMSELNAHTARAITLDIKLFYARIALVKLTFLISEFKDSNPEQAIFDKRLLVGVLPSPLEPLELFNTLTICPPYVMALSLQRPSSLVVFYAERFKTFHHTLFQSLPSYLVPESNPFQGARKRAGFEPPELRFNGESAEFLSIALTATNSFWDFFTKLSNWLDGDGNHQQIRQIKAMSLGKFLINDVFAIQRSSSSFGRIRLTFEFFDKFASLCVERYGNNLDKGRASREAKWAAYLCQGSMLELVQRMFIFRYRTGGKKKIFLLLSEFSIKIRKNIEDDLDSMHRKAGIKRTEASTAESLRLVRNLAHGTFLSGEKFEKTFLKMNPIVPEDIQRLPWLYLLAFSLDPDFFLREATKTLPME